MAAVLERTVGPYKLERCLGIGGMGEVWLGRHARTRGVAAVKLIKKEALDPRLSAALFQRERRAVARLSHPHIVSWHDLGSDYLATTFIPGADLGTHLKRGPLLEHAAVRITLQVASALAHAHERGVIHRDIKPSNILIDREGNASLADFGIALLADEPADDIEGSSHAGTPAYMAPEQRAGKEVGPSADQYALARTFAAMLLGRRPPYLQKELFGALPATLSPALRAVIARATEQDPARRFGSMHELAQALSAAEFEREPASFPPELRGADAFGWTRGATERESIGPDIMRCSYTLNALAQAGLLAADACEAFRRASGYRDFRWSMYGRSGRLGSLDDPSALARVEQIAIGIHGFMCTGDLWRTVALALSKKRGDVIVLAPDVSGFGLSAFQEPVDRGKATPRALMTAIAKWCELLGIADIPTLLVGHSAGAAAVLTLRDDELAPTTHRLALTPVFPQFNPQLRRQLRFGSMFSRVVGLWSGLRRAAAERMVNSPEARDYTQREREVMLENLLAVPPAVFAAIASGFADVQAARGEALERCRIMAMEGDPVAPEKHVLASLRELGFPESKITYLVGGFHLPLAEHEIHPEWTARNIHEISRAISASITQMSGRAPAEEDLGAADPVARLSFDGSSPLAYDDRTRTDRQSGPQESHTAPDDSLVHEKAPDVRAR